MGSKGQTPGGGPGVEPLEVPSFKSYLRTKINILRPPFPFLRIFVNYSSIFSAVRDFFLGAALPCSRGFRCPVNGQSSPSTALPGDMLLSGAFFPSTSKCYIKCKSNTVHIVIEIVLLLTIIYLYFIYMMLVKHKRKKLLH